MRPCCFVMAEFVLFLESGAARRLSPFSLIICFCFVVFVVAKPI